MGVSIERTYRLMGIVFLFAVPSSGRSQEPSGTIDPENKNTFVKEIKADHWTYDLHRITISGFVRNEEDRPVSGATVLLGLSDPNRFAGKDDMGKEYVFDGEIARTQANEDGAYQFVNVLVPMRKGMRIGRAKPLHAPLQVCGFASGKGVTWQPSFQFRPTPKQKTLDDEENVRFSGEPIYIDLTLSDSIPLHGKIRDKLGRPIVGATVRLGKVNLTDDAFDREPIQSRYSSKFGRLRCAILPDEFLATTTDKEGSYEFPNVAQNASIGISITHDSLPSHATMSLNTLGREKLEKKKGTRPPQHQVDIDGLFDIELRTTRELTVRAMTEDTKQPLPNVRFEALSPPNIRTLARESLGIANQEGVAKVKLLPGNIRLKIMPTTGQAYQSITQLVTVDDESDDQAIDFILPTARGILLKSTFGEERLPDIGYEFTVDDQRWERVGTQLSVGENAASNSRGEFRAVIPRDATAIRVARGQIGLEPTNPVQRIDGKVKVKELIFKFTKKDGGPASLATRQKILFGRYKYRKNTQHQPDVTKDGFFRKMRSLRDKRPEQVVAALTDLFSNPRMAHCLLIQQGERRRCESDYSETAGYESLDICDGEHSINYSVDSGQCDIYMSNNSNRAFDSVSDLFITHRRIQDVQPESMGSRLVYDWSKTHRREINGKSQEYEENGHVEIDKETKFLFERINSYGLNGRAIWQFCPKRFDGVQFAQILIETTFQGQKMLRLQLTALDDVQLTEDIPANEFAMQVSAGTTIVDRRARQRNALNSRAPVHRQYFSTFDLLGRINPTPQRRTSSLSYGDSAPELQVQYWAKQGKLVDAPALSGKLVVLCMLDSPVAGDVDELPNVRRAAEKLSQYDDVVFVVLLTDEFSKVDLARFTVTRRMPCYVGVDKRGDKNRPRRNTQTVAAFKSDVLSATAIIDKKGKVSFLASYIGHVDAAVERIVRIQNYSNAK